MAVLWVKKVEIVDSVDDFKLAFDLHDKKQKSRHTVLSFDGARRRSGLGAAAWILWLRNIFEKVSYGGCVLKHASAMIAEREALRKGNEHLTVFFRQ